MDKYVFWELIGDHNENHFHPYDRRKMYAVTDMLKLKAFYAHEIVWKYLLQAEVSKGMG